MEAGIASEKNFRRCATGWLYHSYRFFLTYRRRVVAPHSFSVRRRRGFKSEQQSKSYREASRQIVGWLVIQFRIERTARRLAWFAALRSARRGVLGIVALGVALAGCAGRSPAPVAVIQPQDQFLDCTAIMAEIQSNNAKVQHLASDQGLKTTQNVAAGVAGIFIPVLWFGMDFQGTADKETQALQTRQQYLASLATQRRCGEPAEPMPRTTKQRKAATRPAPVAEAPTQEK